MIPVGEQSPERGNEGERLVEHHMMPRLRNFDHRCGPPEQVEHILADLGRQQH